MGVGAALMDTQPSEPCLGPHTCPGGGETIIALEFCCPDCWWCLPPEKQHGIAAAWPNMPTMLATSLWGARQWLRTNPTGPAPRHAEELTHPCLGWCARRIPTRMVSCQTDWLMLPPQQRIAVWQAWDEGPTQIETGLRGVREWFRSRPRIIDLERPPV
jgi:hypothetical protein